MRDTKPTLDFVKLAAKLASDRNCTDVMILDLRGKSPATDYFLVASGTSARQLRSVCDEISDLARQHDAVRFGRAGYEQGRWILLDFVDVVIHLFDLEYRDYYDLECLWEDVEQVEF